MKLTNSAYRVKSVLVAASHGNEREIAHDVWAKPLGIVSESVLERQSLVAKRLIRLSEQVDYIERWFKNSAFSEELYASNLSRIRNAIAVSNLSAQWSSYKHYITAEGILCLGFCSELMIADNDVSIDELEKVLAEIAKLKEDLVDGSIEAGLKEFIKTHLEGIEDAIHSYPISGAEPVKAAYKKVFEDALVTDLHPETSSDKKLLNSFGKVMSGLKTAGGAAISADKYLTAINHLIDNGGTFVKTVAGYLSNN